MFRGPIGQPVAPALFPLHCTQTLAPLCTGRVLSATRVATLAELALLRRLRACLTPAQL
jgi:hypothetical protein